MTSVHRWISFDSTKQIWTLLLTCVSVSVATSVLCLSRQWLWLYCTTLMEKVCFVIVTRSAAGSEAAGHRAWESGDHWQGLTCSSQSLRSLLNCLLFSLFLLCFLSSQLVWWIIKVMGKGMKQATCKFTSIVINTNVSWLQRLRWVVPTSVQASATLNIESTQWGLGSGGSPWDVTRWLQPMKLKCRTLLD